MFLIKLVPLYQSNRFKRFSPMQGFPRTLNTHESADRRMQKKSSKSQRADNGCHLQIARKCLPERPVATHI